MRPKGRHLATVVWLHGLGDNGSRYTYMSFTPLLDVVTAFITLS